MSPIDESMRPIRDALAAFGGVRVTACSDGHAGTETFHVAMRIDSIDVLARLAHALPLQQARGGCRIARAWDRLDHTRH